MISPHSFLLAMISPHSFLLAMISPHRKEMKPEIFIQTEAVLIATTLLYL
ncbi:unnamed protein product [Larinioides sclopetarius]|uniref:NADH dehydrogenase subunit 4L n=1 Tax=Larinioides sclopetarius TaxID=280406 RepID=A0AAV2BTD5_9ARAC